MVIFLRTDSQEFDANEGSWPRAKWALSRLQKRYTVFASAMSCTISYTGACRSVISAFSDNLLRPAAHTSLLVPGDQDIFSTLQVTRPPAPGL